jgi:PAS domain S-box-containing protein
MYSFWSAIFSVLAFCGSLSMGGPVSGHHRQDGTGLAVGEMRVSSGTVLDRSLPHSLSGVHTSQWLMLLAALALGATGLSMVLLSERRPQVRATDGAGLNTTEPAPLNGPTLLIRDLDDRIVDWSSGAQRFYGFSRQEALGRFLDDELQSMYPKRLSEIKGLLLRHGTWQGEIRRRTKDGRFVLVTSRWTLQKNENGEPVAITEIDTDITGGADGDASSCHQEEEPLLGNTLPTRIFYLDNDRRYRAVNQAFTAWFGLPKHAIVGLHVKELLGDTAWAIVRPWLDRAYAGELVEYQAEIPYRQGGTKWIHAVYTPHRNADGIVVGVAVLVSDITKQKRAEQDLRVSEERYQYIFDTVGVSIFEEDWTGIKDMLRQVRSTGVGDLRAFLDSHPEMVHKALRQVVITDVNQYTLHLFKADSKSALLGSLDRIFLPETIEVFKEELIAAWEGRDVYRGHAPLRTLRGDELSVLFTLVVPKREMDWQRVMITLTDVTGLRQAEASLRESEQHLRTALAAGHMAAWDMDLTTGALAWDDKHAALFGIAADKVPGVRDHLYQLVHPDDRERVRAGLETATVLGVFEEEFRIRRPDDGSLRWIKGQGTVLTNTEGRPIRLVGVHSDITERKDAHVRLETFAHELERAVETRTAELRRSQEQLRALAAELTLTEQRERQRFASELHDHLQQLLVLGKMKLSQAKRSVQAVPLGVSLIEQVEEAVNTGLDYSRSLIGELSPPVLRQHGLVAGIKWLAEWMERMNLTVSVEAHEDHVSLPEAESVLLFQSVRELLFNAAKYAGTGRASVRLDVLEGDLCIQIRDEGAGFNYAAVSGSEPAPDSTRSSKFGLFSIQERMTALGGSFEIRSDVGQGTEATLRLPLMLSVPVDQPSVSIEMNLSSEVPEEPVESHLRVNAQHIRLLVADDHAMVREGLRTLLESYADVHVVGEAGNGREAIEASAQLGPDVVIMDINMPDMTGVEATANIKRRHPTTIVIGISVNADHQSIAAMLGAGAAMVMPKEAAVTELYQAVKRVWKPVHETGPRNEGAASTFEGLC